MIELNIPNPPHAVPMWEFVNLFYDRRQSVYYCRLRKVEIGKNQNDWKEVTSSGATMQIAFDNACEAAREHGDG